MSTPSKDITATISAESNTDTRLSQPTYTRIIQTFRLIWLDANIDEVNDKDWRDNIKRLRCTINTIDTFTDADQGIQFLENIKDERVFLVVTGYVGEYVVANIHDIAQLDSIYILCGNKSRHEEWVKQWLKIRGVFTEISSICEALKKAAQQSDQNCISIGFMSVSDNPSTQNLDQLEPSFMYTQILKGILLTIDFDDSYIKEFTDYCRQKIAADAVGRSIIDELEQNYHEHTPIWFYTYHSFLYSILNQALRQMDVDIIIKMGFLASDLHRQIERLHFEQYNDYQQSQPLIVHRGQGLPTDDFDRMLKTKGGLISFNNFLSTSTDINVSLSFAREALTESNMIPVLFVITIDPSISSTPFASVSKFSDFEKENEILFSMHAVFRIGNIEKMESDNRLWKITLTVTGDNDQKLLALTKRIREETAGSTGWHELAMFLIKVAKFDKAQQLLELLLAQTSDLAEKSFIYNMLGIAGSGQGQYSKALSFYKRALGIYQETLPENHLNLATIYSNIGQVHSNMGEYSKALSFYEKALGIQKETLPENHLHLANSYSNIGQVYSDMGEYTKALSFYKKDLEITQESLPANHPDLATSYSNIGQVYSNMSEYSQALSFYEKALGIYQETLPANHPSLATSYSNIGQVHSNMGEYSQALSFYEKALGIRQESLPANHPHLATSYSKIGPVYFDMGKYSKALSFYEQALAIDRETLPANHPDLATSYSNIGQVYNSLGEYSKALSYQEEARNIYEKSLPVNHLSLATLYTNIGQVYYNMGEYAKALSSHEKALEIREKICHPNHPHLAISYSNIGEVYLNIDEYSKALSYHEKAVQIREKSLHLMHPDMAICYNNIGLVYSKMGEYSKALSFYEKAIDIRQRTLPPNHPYLATSYDNIGNVHENMDEYEKALSFYQCALDIGQCSLPESHPHLQLYRDHVEFVKSKL
jgi:tetratricopeptide (TPR) repeat protein